MLKNEKGLENTKILLTFATETYNGVGNNLK